MITSKSNLPKNGKQILISDFIFSIGVHSRSRNHNHSRFRNHDRSRSSDAASPNAVGIDWCEAEVGEVVEGRRKDLDGVEIVASLDGNRLD